MKLAKNSEKKKKSPREDGLTLHCMFNIGGQLYIREGNKVHFAVEPVLEAQLDQIQMFPNGV